MPQVSKLYRLHAQYQAALAAENNPPEGNRFERAVAKSMKLAEALVKTPANSVDEMLVKIQVVECEGEGLEYDALFSLRRDLRRLHRRAA